MAKINILHLITELNVGGTERRLAQTLVRLDRNKYNIIVACLFDAGEVAKQIRADGIKVINLGMKHKFDPRVLYRLFRLIGQEHIHILHTHLFHANILGRIIGKLAGVRVIISSEVNLEMESGYRHLINRFTLCLADRMTIVSRTGYNFARRRLGIKADKLQVLYGSIDPANYQVNKTHPETRKSLELPPDTLIITTISRLHKIKGVEYLIRAIPDVIKFNRNVVFLVVGYGSEQKRLEELSSVLEVNKNVRFTGYRSDIAEILSITDIFVLSSLSEALPIAILETMLMKKPVVATAVGGIVEVVKDGVTGILVPPKNPERLAEAIIRLLNNPQERQLMGEEGCQLVRKHFTIDKRVKETQRMYDELISIKHLGLK